MADLGTIEEEARGRRVLNDMREAEVELLRARACFWQNFGMMFIAVAALLDKVEVPRGKR